MFLWLIVFRRSLSLSLSLSPGCSESKKSQRECNTESQSKDAASRDASTLLQHACLQTKLYELIIRRCQISPWSFKSGRSFIPFVTPCLNVDNWVGGAKLDNSLFKLSWCLRFGKHFPAFCCCSHDLGTIALLESSKTATTVTATKNIADSDHWIKLYDKAFVVKHLRPFRRHDPGIYFEAWDLEKLLHKFGLHLNLQSQAIPNKR